MININTKNINSEIVSLNKLIEDYNTNYLNLFNNINQIQSSWIGETAEKYFDQINQDKMNTEKLLNQIKSEEEIYKYIYNSYKELGSSIKCNLNAKEELINKVNNCIDKSTEILNIYQSINTSKAYEERDSIIKKRENTKKVLNKYKEVKENIKKVYQKIEEIEQEVNTRIDKIIES